MTADAAAVARVAEQLRAELGMAAHSIGVIAGPDAAITWEQTILSRCDHLARQLADGEPAEVAEIVIDVMTVLWPHTGPERCGQPEWWTSPLGRLCARSLRQWSSDEEVTHAVAAAMLGISRGTVGTMVHRGVLDRGHSGGVTLPSILRRISQKRPPREQN